MIIDNEKLKEHEGHTIVLATYVEDNKEVWSVSLECENCYEVIADVDTIDEVTEMYPSKADLNKALF